jgi:hypothetical protein
MREIDMGGVVVADALGLFGAFWSLRWLTRNHSIRNISLSSREICFLDMMALSLDDSCFRPESSSADTNRHLFEQSSFAGLPEFYLWGMAML